MMPTATDPTPFALVAEIAIHLNLLNCDDKRVVTRVLQHYGHLKGKLTDQVLAMALSKLSPSITGNLGDCLNALLKTTAQNGDCIANSWPVSLYLALLTATHFWSAGRQAEALQLVSVLLETAQTIQTPTLARLIDGILAKAWSLWLLGRERAGELSIPFLMVSLRSASLRHQTDCQAVIHNGIMRAYQLAEQWELAAKFQEHAAFPSAVSNAQLARHYYYQARLAAMTMEYEKGQELAEQALRKCPHGPSALGFRQAAQRLAWVLSLLHGTIPDRTQFTSLVDRPYQRLCSAVRSGNVALFEQIISGSDAEVFKRHQLHSLILRLHHNVVRMALQRLNRAYQRLPLVEVASLLRLGSAADAECVVMKAIHEGAIRATINHQQGYMETEHLAHPYYTRVPQSQLDERINHTQSLYAHMLKTMRFTEQDQKENAPKERVSELELMEEYLENDDDLPF